MESLKFSIELESENNNFKTTLNYIDMSFIDNKKILTFDNNILKDMFKKIKGNSKYMLTIEVYHNKSYYERTYIRSVRYIFEYQEGKKSILNNQCPFDTWFNIDQKDIFTECQNLILLLNNEQLKF